MRRSDFKIGNRIILTKELRGWSHPVQENGFRGVVVDTHNYYEEDIVSVRLDGYNYRLEESPDNHHPLNIDKHGVQLEVSDEEVAGAIASIREALGGSHDLPPTG